MWAEFDQYLPSGTSRVPLGFLLPWPPPSPPGASVKRPQQRSTRKHCPSQRQVQGTAPRGESLLLSRASGSLCEFARGGAVPARVSAGPVPLLSPPWDLEVPRPVNALIPSFLPALLTAASLCSKPLTRFRI